MADRKYLEGMPDWLVEKHPEVEQIYQALDAYRNGREVTARCPRCGNLLVVFDKQHLGSLWIACGTPECTLMHMKYIPQRSEPEE